MRKIFLSLLLLITLSACNRLQIDVEPTATSAPLPLLVASSTPAAVGTPAVVITWQMFQGQQLGVQFEYPTALADVACAPYEQAQTLTQPATIVLGHRSSVTILPAVGVFPSDYLTKTLAAQSLTLDSTTEEIIGGQVGITVNYRFGGTNRFGTMTAVKWDERLYVFALTAGDFCDVPLQGVTELLAYDHMKATFQFVSAPVEALPVKPIAIVTDFTPGQSDIAIINSDGTEYVQLTTYGFNLNPVLSPNGQYIAYRSVPASITSLPDWGARWAEGNFNIWVVAADGSQAWKLTDSELPRSVPAWSPDSTKVIFSEAPTGRIVEVDFATGTQREWLAQDGRDPRYQHHGQGIGYISTAGSLIALNADGFTQTLVDVAALPPATTVYDFEWLMDRDSTVVYTLADTSEQIANIGVGIKYSAWLLASPGSPVLLAEGAHDIQPSPSGQYLAVQMGSGYGDACMVDLRQGFLASARTTPWPALSTDDFAERPVGESFYPLSAVTWISDHLALAQFGVTCAPDASTQGLYLLDVLNQHMKLIRPLETR